ncbi:MAG: alpha-amylase [Chloroflexaceae bacterium]|nr:alpha-amylase [Chloroflexaceae bacterium]
MTKTQLYSAQHTRQVFLQVQQHLTVRLQGQRDSAVIDRFLFSLGHHFQDLYHPLLILYGQRSDFTTHLNGLIDTMLSAYIERSAALRQRDDACYTTPDWFQHETMVGYACYVDQFAGNLKGAMQRLDYLEELGITYLQLRSLLQPREGADHDGWAIQDYRKVDQRIGTIEDLAELATVLHARGISLGIELVLNHTAQEHAWAQQAMQGDPTYLSYYLTFDDRNLPDAYERTLREMLPACAPGNFTWVPDLTESGKWVWTTFHGFEWDLNYRNPAVFRDMAATMLFLGNLGIDVLCLNAVPFIWKTMGSSCENQPEAHLLLQAFRAVMRIVAPSIIFQIDASVPTTELVHYLGSGPATGKECELACHHQLMVLLWSTLATTRVNLLHHVLQEIPPTPPGSTWLTYIRDHDDIVWQIADDDASAVGENGTLHRQFLTNFYRGYFPGSFARGVRVQAETMGTEHERIIGTTASLTGMEQALEHGDARGLDLAIRRIVLLYSVVMVVGGIPLMMMGDELGLLNDPDFIHHPQHANDNRWMHRPVMDWSRADLRHVPQTATAQIYHRLQQLILARKQAFVLHGANPGAVLVTSNPHVLALTRQHPCGRFLLLANFHHQVQQVPAALTRQANLRDPVRNVLDTTGQRPLITGGNIALQPYESVWLIDV